MYEINEVEFVEKQCVLFRYNFVTITYHNDIESNLF